MSCLISFCSGHRTESFTSINICFNCITNLKNDNFDFGKLIYIIKTIPTTCICNDEIKFGTSINIGKSYLIKHLKNNKENYLKRLKKVEEIIEEKRQEIIELIKNEPRDVWLKRVKSLPIDIEEDYDIWLEEYQKERESKKNRLELELKCFRDSLLEEQNISIYQCFDI
jgi:hypothetical protein